MSKSKMPSISKLQKVDLTKSRNDVAIMCEGCGEVLTHVHLCPTCMSALEADPEHPEATE